MATILEQFCVHHRRLITSAQLLNAQLTKQKEVTNEMIGHSKSIIAEMRHLSLVRSTLIRGRRRTAAKIVNSQPYKGLSFSSLEYCPDFLDPNIVNQYGFFTSFVRRNPDDFAELLFQYSIAHPRKVHRMAYSVLRAICQQGWCVEEDELLYQTLKSMAQLQFRGHRDRPSYARPDEPRKLSLPRSSINVAVNHYQPFITFSTAYLFNGTSLAFLQCALSPIIVKLHSLSTLFNLRATFQVVDLEPGKTLVATFQYWRGIVSYAQKVITSLSTCVELLPPGVFHLMTVLSELDVDLYLVFFESFINRALDNPAVLGLLPWNPSHEDWNPSKDIADVFRTKNISSLKSRGLTGLKSLLESIPAYNEMDIDEPLSKIVGQAPPANPFMISESELLSTNPSFPKELLVTGTDLVLLHEAAITSTVENAAFAHIVSSLGAVPERADSAMGQHFRIVITRPKLLKKGSGRAVSLFAIQVDTNELTSAGDAYAGLFCDIVASLPTAESFGVSSVFQFVERLALVAPLFLDERAAIQAESVLWYARSIIDSEESLVERFCALVNARDLWTLRATDRTCSLRSQHQRLASALERIKSTRSNLQSHLNLELTEFLMKDSLAQGMKEAMFHGHEFASNVEAFENLVYRLTSSAQNILSELGASSNAKQICRLLFFKLTAHVTFRRFLQTAETVWKHSIIVGKIIEANRAAITANLRTVQTEAFALRRSYFERACDLLGHIKNNSGLSVIVYYVLEVVHIVQTLCSQCRDLNFDECLLWVVVSTEMKHMFPISHYLQHFILMRGKFLDLLFERQEISLLGVFPSAVYLLLKVCKTFDKRVEENWAGTSARKTLGATEEVGGRTGGLPRRHSSMILK
jgi:hypothetical protein